MSDIYSAPTGPLTKTGTAPNYGSLERGIAGDYQFSIGDALNEAWSKTKGAKGTIHLALVLYLTIVLGVSIVFGVLGTVGALAGVSDNFGAMLAVQGLMQLVITAIQMPMLAGLYLIGLRRAVDAPISAGLVLRYFSKLLPILLLTILMYLLIAIGFVLLVIPGIYLMVAYSLALLLVADKDIGVWQALEASRKAVSKRWFTVFGFYLLLGLLNFATIFTLFIGMIWTIPMSVIAFGILYRNIFGIEPATLND